MNPYASVHTFMVKNRTRDSREKVVTGLNKSPLQQRGQNTLLTTVNDMFLKKQVKFTHRRYKLTIVNHQAC